MRICKGYPSDNTASAANKKIEVMLNGLTALKEQYSHLSQVEVDEVASLVCHIRAKITTHDAMPGRIVFLVKFFLDECSYVL